MLQILVNGKPVQLLQPPPLVVTSLSVTAHSHPLQPLRVRSDMGKPIVEWLYNIAQSVTHTITYNGTIISKDSINKPQHMKE